MQEKISVQHLNFNSSLETYQVCQIGKSKHGCGFSLQTPSEDYIVLVAKESYTILGFAEIIITNEIVNNSNCFCWNKESEITIGTINNLIVHPDHQKRSVEFALLRECLMILKFRTSVIMVNAFPETRNFFENQGFRIINSNNNRICMVQNS